MDADWVKRKENETKEDWHKRVWAELQANHKSLLDECVKESEVKEEVISKTEDKWFSLPIGIAIGFCSCLLAGTIFINNQNQQTLDKIRLAEERINQTEYRILQLNEKIGAKVFRQATSEDFK